MCSSSISQILLLKKTDLFEIHGFWRWLSAKKKKKKEERNLCAKQETWVRSLGGEDFLEKEMATYSSIPPGISWTEGPGGLVCGVARVGQGLVTKQQDSGHEKG